MSLDKPPRAMWTKRMVALGARTSTAQAHVAQMLRRVCSSRWDVVEELNIDDSGLLVDIACPGERLAIEYDGPHHYFFGPARQPMGRTIFKHRLVRALGWKLIVVPWFEWRALGGRALDEKAFLGKRLVEIGMLLDTGDDHLPSADDRNDRASNTLSTGMVSVAADTALNAALDLPVPPVPPSGAPARMRGEICLLKCKYGFIRKSTKGKRIPHSSENAWFSLTDIDGGAEAAAALRVGDVVEYDVFVNDAGKPNGRHVMFVSRPPGGPASAPAHGPDPALRSSSLGREATACIEGISSGTPDTNVSTQKTIEQQQQSQEVADETLLPEPELMPERGQGGSTSRGKRAHLHNLLHSSAAAGEEVEAGCRQWEPIADEDEDEDDEDDEEDEPRETIDAVGSALDELGSATPSICVPMQNTIECHSFHHQQGDLWVRTTPSAAQRAPTPSVSPGQWLNMCILGVGTLNRIGWLRTSACMHENSM